MDVNPYESPKAVGYQPSRKRSRWGDVLACVGTGIVIHLGVQAIAQFIRISGWDWQAGLRWFSLFAAAAYVIALSIIASVVTWRAMRPRLSRRSVLRNMFP
jgi:hypothetical protein